MHDLVTLRRQASSLLGTRAWHNQRLEPFVASSAHPTIEIAWHQSGAPVEYVVGARHLTLHASAAILVPAHVDHRTSLARGTRAHVIGLDPSVIEEVADAHGVRADLQARVATDERLLRLCAVLFDETVLAAPGHELVVDTLTEALAAELLRAPSTDATGPGRRPRDPRIQRAIDYIDASFVEPLSLEAIAKVAGMSRFHFARMFGREVGRSPHRYLLDVRIERAAAMIRTGRVTVTNAALSVGYNDLSRFGRSFRARFGVTPSEALAASRPRAPLTRAVLA